jgi:hypothetical protein
MKTINVKISNITEAQAIALEDMFSTWIYLGNIGSSKWTCFFADGDGNFRPKIEVNGNEAQFAPTKIISNEVRKTLWDNGEYRIDFDYIASKLNNQPNL